MRPEFWNLLPIKHGTLIPGVGGRIIPPWEKNKNKKQKKQNRGNQSFMPKKILTPKGVIPTPIQKKKSATEPGFAWRLTQMLVRKGLGTRGTAIRVDFNPRNTKKLGKVSCIRYVPCSHTMDQVVGVLSSYKVATSQNGVWLSLHYRKSYAVVEFFSWFRWWPEHYRLLYSTS